MTSKKHEFEHDVKLDVEARVRQGIKTVLEEVLQEEMSQHLEAGYRELTPSRRGERNGYYQRNLLTPAGKIERLEVPREREGEFVTKVFERYKRMSGDVEEAVSSEGTTRWPSSSTAFAFYTRTRTLPHYSGGNFHL